MSPARRCRGYRVDGSGCNNVTNNVGGLCGRCGGQAPSLPIRSTSLAQDVGLIALADIGDALRSAGVFDSHRLIGGLMVSGHIWRLKAALPLRVTADADFGFTPMALRSESLVPAIEALGYVKVTGNTWQRDLGGDTVASADLLVAAPTSRHRSNRRIGDVVTDEVPGLGLALARPPVPLCLAATLTSGHEVMVDTLLADTLSAVGLKAHAWRLRFEENDAEDLWRCLELAHLDGARRPEDGRLDPITDVIPTLERFFTGRGSGLDAASLHLSEEAAAGRRARIAALTTRLIGR